MPICCHTLPFMEQLKAKKDLYSVYSCKVFYKIREVYSTNEHLQSLNIYYLRGKEKSYIYGNLIRITQL